jgi:CheY-like chemotaxis protein
MSTSERERFAAAVRAQAAVVRTVADELRRSEASCDAASGLHGQVVEESARLVSVMTDPERASTRPAISATHAERLEASGVPAAPSGTRRRVLIVDDENATLSALARWFEHDYDVAVACDGEAGLAEATRRIPDIIIADVWMPKLDGVAMVHRIKRIERLAKVPVVFLTGQTAPESVAAGFSVGAVSYLAKPVDLDLLNAEIIAALSISGE